uniref:E-selectin n=1 Tax=Maylandia zebra TaxID=106582 RepID=A0A3P9BJU3_9CICH
AHPKSGTCSSTLVLLSWSYFYSDNAMTWDDARSWCQEHYTDMVAIQNQEELEHLNNWLPKKNGYYWIGIRRINNVWTWVGTNKPLTEEATNWAKGEPNNNEGDKNTGMHEDCVEMYIKRDKEPGKWNDERCTKSKTALCYTAACKIDSCFHGECVETINSHKCDCFEGFFGHKCDQVVQCNKGEVVVPDKGHVNCSHKYGSFSYDSLCQYSCEEGYKLSVPGPLRCTSLGKWSEKPPTCEKLTHGSMKCSDPLGSFSYQSTCTFTCDEGYVLSGSSSLQCESSANWNGSQPYCVAVQCPALQNLTNGFVSCGEDADTRFSYKNTCSFSCDQGYHLVGASRVTCTSGGTWNQQIPHCEGKRNTKSITHHLLYHEDTFNKIHMFLCQPSFARIQREKLPSSCSAVNLRLNCDQTPPAASAVKKVLNCREQTPSSTNYINIYYKQCYSTKGCPAPEVPTNGQISCSPSLSSFLSHDTPHPLGMVCHFTCDEGHELQGAHTTTDQRGKQKFTLFTFHCVSTAPAPVAAVTAGIATGGIAFLSGVLMAMWIFKKLKKSNKFEQVRKEFTSFKSYMCLLGFSDFSSFLFYYSISDIEAPPQSFQEQY